MDFSFSFRTNKPGQPKPQQPQANPAEPYWNAVRGCGITPKDKVTLAMVTEGHDPAVWEQAPYPAMLIALAGYDAEGNPFSDDVFRLAWRSIQSEGDYAAIAYHIARLAKGRLPIEEISDEVVPDEGRATLRFTLDGEAVEWGVELSEGMFAGEVLSALAGIIAERGEGSRLAAMDLGDESWILACVTEEELRDLVETTGMEWSWVE